MKNQLAIVCPTTNLASYVEATFMKKPAVYTAFGTTVHTNSETAMADLAEQVILKDVSVVSFVVDVNAILIRKFLSGESTGTAQVDRYYQYIFDNYVESIKEKETAYEQRVEFTHHLIKEQVIELVNAFNQLDLLDFRALTVNGYAVDISADTKWSVFTDENILRN
jgi:hypothetical protein